MLLLIMVVNYKGYTQTTMLHLHEAARITQKHARIEQDKQAKDYNKRAKGAHLNTRDRVHKDNKGKKGKKKLADRWSITAYTVKDRNLQIYTYK